MNWKKSGYLVETKDGKKGRTFHGKELVNGKIPVYLATRLETFKDQPGFEVPLEFSEIGTLCDPTTLKQIGFID